MKIDSVHSARPRTCLWAWQEAGGKVVAAHQASTTTSSTWDGANAAILRSGAAMHIALNGMMDRTMALDLRRTLQRSTPWQPTP